MKWTWHSASAVSSRNNRSHFTYYKSASPLRWPESCLFWNVPRLKPQVKYYLGDILIPFTLDFKLSSYHIITVVHSLKMAYGYPLWLQYLMYLMRWFVCGTKYYMCADRRHETGSKINYFFLRFYRSEDKTFNKLSS